MRWCSDQGIPHSQLLAWDPEDRSKLHAYLTESSAQCQLCGTAPWEWEEDPFAYEAMVVMCHGCAIKEMSKDDAEDQPGTRVSLVPKAIAQAAREAPKRTPKRRRASSG